MAETISVTIRMDANTKANVDAVCERMGLSFATAANILAKKIIAEERIPFEITATPNQTTLDAMAEPDTDLLGPFYSVAEFMEAMNADN